MKKITLWTIQSLEAWNQLKDSKILSNHKDKVDSDWLFAYNWMRSQMKKRLKKSRGINYPIWAWVNHKPDLRVERHLLNGEVAVLIKLSIAEDQVLLSDFDAWHFVLNKYPLYNNKKEEEFWDSCIKKYANNENAVYDQLPKRFKRQVLKSWEKIFNIKLMQRGCVDPYTQAVIKEIKLQDVLEYKIFNKNGTFKKDEIQTRLS
jgi:hypothetical protein